MQHAARRSHALAVLIRSCKGPVWSPVHASRGWASMAARQPALAVSVIASPSRHALAAPGASRKITQYRSTSPYTCYSTSPAATVQDPDPAARQLRATGAAARADPPAQLSNTTDAPASKGSVSERTFGGKDQALRAFIREINQSCKFSDLARGTAAWQQFQVYPH